MGSEKGLPVIGGSYEKGIETSDQWIVTSHQLPLTGPYMLVPINQSLVPTY